MSKQKLTKQQRIEEKRQADLDASQAKKVAEIEAKEYAAWSLAYETERRETERIEELRLAKHDENQRLRAAVQERHLAEIETRKNEPLPETELPPERRANPALASTWSQYPPPNDDHLLDEAAWVRMHSLGDKA